MDIDPKTIRRKIAGYDLKRDNWTNEEVLDLLNEMEFHYKCDQPELEKYERSEEYTAAIEDVRDIFEAFKAPEDQYCGPMAYDKKSGLCVYIGPPLPVC
tara:strand:+ start:259 stop:555 length:297 start_codon:yes stop_codon:yes gene_type:complete